MKNMMHKTTLREIKQTFGRFFAIFAIIALGVGFFSGVRITTPAIVHTVNLYFRENQLYDYRLVSTLGWEKEDVEEFRKQEDVRYVEGSYTIDVIYKEFQDTNESSSEQEFESAIPEESSDDSTIPELILKTHSLPKNISKIQVVKGRLPEKEDECVIDSVVGDKPDIGGRLRVLDSNEEDTMDMLKVREFTVVGWVDSSYYINFERGTTSIGTGTVDGFIYVPEESFDSDVYTEIFVKFDEDLEIYSKDYKEYMKEKNKVWEDLTEKIAQARYDRIISEAEEEIADGEQELADKKKEGEEELADAKQELDDGKQELEDAEDKLTDARETLDDSKRKLNTAGSKLADASNQLRDSKPELDKAKKELDKAKAKLDKAEKKLDKADKTIKKGEASIKSGQSQIDTAKAQLDASDADLKAQEAAFAEKEKEYLAQMEQAKPMWDFLPEDQQAALTQAGVEIETGRAALESARAQIEAGKAQIAQNQAALDKAKAELEKGKKDYKKGLAEYKTGLSKYKKGLAKYNDGLKEYNNGKKEYEKGLAEYNDGKRKYTNGEKEYEDGLAEYEDGKKEYEDGVKEYEDGVKEFNEKIADAEKEIADAKDELADVKKPDTFLLERNTNIGYACFDNDSAIVAQVARVLPVFFVLVAALVCITTMSRMVEEQRTQIGVFKALGYSEGTIMGKYMFYSGSAAVLGCILGYVGGIHLFPAVIWHTFQLMYHALPIKFIFDVKLASLSLLASVVCSLGTTWIAVRYELAETAASLMRPKAPKAGKRVFLEYVPFVWNNLKFLHKVSIRNLLRYKGRFFMMIIGIGGCTALLVAGLGIKDSIADFASMQYDEILTADASIVLKDINKRKLPDHTQEVFEETSDSYLLLHQSSWDMLSGDKVKEVTLLVPDESDSIGKYMNFHDMDQEPLTFPKKGEAYICNALSERYDVGVGDEIVFRNEDMKELHVKIAAVFENHVYNYVFMSKDTLEEQLGAPLKINAAFMNFPEGSDIYKLQTKVAKDDNVTSVMMYEEVKERMSKMMSRLDYIVLVVIISAAGLAAIVLYNLTNINITERIREIATIKVLGFFKRETSAYVFRENFALTAIGVIFGLGLGILFHKFIMAQLIVDMVSFKSRILPRSFVLSAVMTFVFTFIINAFMEIKLEKINMAESLKSVE